MKNKSDCKLNNEKKVPAVVIAVSTYNGSRYLEDLLHSLISQDYANYRVIIRDDGSFDSTPAIIDDFCRKYPDKIFSMKCVEGNMGVAQSFLKILRDVEEGEYLMFCDQDDVWFEDKISTFMNHIREVEQDGKLPTLVFGDMMVTDQNLNILASSFWAYQRIDTTNASDWRRLMISNVVTGCSSLCNSAAINCLRSAPQLELLHDHLAAILIAKHGVVVPLSKPTMFYRQHFNNVEGARAFGLRYLVGRFGYFVRLILPRYYAMCKEFGVPLSLAAYLKLETICKRFVKS